MPGGRRSASAVPIMCSAHHVLHGVVQEERDHLERHDGRQPSREVAEQGRQVAVRGDGFGRFQEQAQPVAIAQAFLAVADVGGQNSHVVLAVRARAGPNPHDRPPPGAGQGFLQNRTDSAQFRSVHRAMSTRSSAAMLSLKPCSMPERDTTAAVNSHRSRSVRERAFVRFAHVPHQRDAEDAEGDDVPARREVVAEARDDPRRTSGAVPPAIAIIML